MRIPADSDSGGLRRMSAALILAVIVTPGGSVALSCQQPAGPRTAAEILTGAAALFERKRYNEAIDAYSAAIRLEPGSAAIYALRARVWGAKHARDREVADLTDAIRLDPTTTDYLVARALSWSSQGHHEQAMADYDEAIRLRPREARLYVARGDEWRRHLKLDLALADYDLAIRLAPDDVHAYLCRAMVAKQRRAFAQAVAELAHLARMAPENAEVHRALARILATCYKDGFRDGRRAVQEATRACELTRWRDPDCLDTLAAAYAEAGDYQSAVEWQKKAIARARNEVTSPMQRAMNAGGRRGVGFEDRLAFYQRKRPARE
jgi:tetratricopeptide (TPR) repeat protein